MIQDLHHTLRGLRRSPWYTATIIGVIALGMALSTTVFAVVDGVLFKPIDLPALDRLFSVRAAFRGTQPAAAPFPVSSKDLHDWMLASPEIRVTGFRTLLLDGFGEGVNHSTARGAVVERNVFDVLGVRPLLGGFSDSDFEIGPSTLPVIITWNVWQDRFGGDPQIIGLMVGLDRAQHTSYRVAGVMPRQFVFPSATSSVEFIVPDVAPPSAVESPLRRLLSEVVARAPTGMSGDVLKARIEAGMAVTAASFPDIGSRPPSVSDDEWRSNGPYDQASVEPLSIALRKPSRSLFGATFLASVLLIVIGALNASSLMAARTLDRTREIVARRALGISNIGLARLILMEALILVGAGSILGLIAGGPLVRFALTLLPEETVLLKPVITIDWRVAAFAVICSILLAVPAAVWPARRAFALGSGLTSEPSGHASQRRMAFGHSIAISAQIAGAFVLSVAGTLVVGSLLRVYSNAYPINTKGVLLVETEFEGAGGRGGVSPERNARTTLLLDSLRRAPGVDRVAVTSQQILVGTLWPSDFKAPPGANQLADVEMQGVRGDYYQILQPELVAGRLPSVEEVAGDARVLVVSETVADAYWPGTSGLGQTLVEGRDPEPYTVVGVVKDVRWSAWDVTTASIYGPYHLLSRSPMPNFIIHTNGRPDEVAAGVLRVLRETDPLLRPLRAATLNDLLIESVRARRYSSWLFGSFAVASLCVVSLGLLGLLAMATARRAKEIGIRLAVGASPRSIVGLLVREHLTPITVGLGVGTIVASWTMTLVQAYLYQITVYDPRVWIAAAAVLSAAAALGALAPAVRASRFEPSQVLRNE